MLKQIQQFFPQQVFVLKGGSSFFNDFDRELAAAKVRSYCITAPTLLLDHTREILAASAERADEPFYIVCHFETLHGSAHQLLLKTLEEPGENKFYCLITPHPKTLPATILSRAHLLSDVATAEATTSEFAKLPTEAQLAYITKHFGGDAETADKKSHALRLLDELEHVHQKTDPKKISTLYDAKKMLLQANLAPKQVLEFVVTML
ncbi:MAG TPA: hypothetical protein VLB02_00140 [Candidatus Paceibacterota bacterium]|nr:hypothetical protein [Candidatus Paceibacterota bacterium]